MNKSFLNKVVFKIIAGQKITLFFLAAILLFTNLYNPALVSAQTPEPMDVFMEKQYQHYKANWEYHPITPAPQAYVAPTPKPTPTPSPEFFSTFASIPDIKPKTKDDYLVLPYYQKLKSGKMTPWQASLFAFLYGIPFVSTQTKLNLYNFLVSLHLPYMDDPRANPVWLYSILMLWPFLILALMILGYISVRLLISFLRIVLPILFKRFIKNEQLTFLELTFPHDTSKSAYATEQLYQLLHSRARSRTLLETLSGQKKTYSLEIVSSRNFGIRYLIAIPQKETQAIYHSLLSFIPGLKIREVKDYLDEELPQLFANSKTKRSDLEANSKKDKDKNKAKNKTREMKPGLYEATVVELKLSRHFAMPLKDQKTLTEHDPISFLTGNMAQLALGELISFQLITSPIISSVHSKARNQINKLKYVISKREPISPLLYPGLFQRLRTNLGFNILYYSLIGVLKTIWFGFLFVISVPILVLDTKHGFETAPLFAKSVPKPILPATLDPYEEELHNVVKDKIHSHLFETTLRILVVGKDSQEVDNRAESLIAAAGLFTSTHQSLVSKLSLADITISFLCFLPFIPTKLAKLPLNKSLAQFKDRSLSKGLFHNELLNPILSSSEVADLYHFPYTDLTKTAGLLKSRNKDLPAPLSMKKSDTNLDIIMGKNSYGGEDTPIGMSLEQRQRHTYLIGKTGMGKTEMLKNMIYQDMVNGKGLAVLDPHGDLFHELLGLVPKERIKDVVVFNPADKDYPIGLNILSSGIKFVDWEEGQDKIVSTTLSVFQKITDDKYWGPRLEHILRNALQTSLFTPTPSFWVVQKLLTSDKEYQKQVAKTLDDPILKQFWNQEFALYGKMQQGDVISPITNKIGKFITSHMSRNILLQPKSTFNIQENITELQEVKLKLI